MPYTALPRARRLPRLRAALPYLVAGGLFLMGLVALNRLLAEINLAQVSAQIAQTPWNVMGLAMLCTLGAYLCLAGYDWSALRHIGKPLPGPVVITGGLMAYAFGNTIGLTAISGGAVRWRVYSGLGLDGYDIAAISTFTSVSYGVAATVVGLAALASHPGALAPLLPMGAAQVQVLALAAIAAIIAPLIWAAWSGRGVRLGRFTLRAPRIGVLLGQMVISIGDICLSAMTLYLFLPVTDFGFLTFVAVFAAATMAGVLSHVPGGIGVFETAIIAAMPAGTPVDQVAAALLLYRLVYYFVPFGLALALLAAYEAWRAIGGRRQPALLSAIEPALRAVSALAPLLLAVMIFGSGLWMTLAAVLDPLARMTELHRHFDTREAAEAAEALFPLAFVEGSALVSSALGTALIVLSLWVVRRSRGGFWLAVAAMVTGAVVALIQGLDAQRVIILLAGAAILLPFRHAFYRRAMLTHAALTPGWVAMMLAALAGFGFVLFFARQGLPYADEMWWQFAADQRAPRPIRAGLIGGLIVGVVALAALLRVPRFRPARPDAPALRRAARIVAHHPHPAAALALTGDKALIFDDNHTGMVAFGTTGASWIALGPPLGAGAEDAGFAFVDAARRAGARPLFYAVGARDRALMRDLGLVLHQIGDDACVELARFAPGPAVQAAMAAPGLAVTLARPPHDPALLAELRAVSDDWLAPRKGREKGFNAGRFDPAWLGRWPIAVLRDQGRAIAMASVLFADEGRAATIDLLRLRRAAPPQAMTALFGHLMIALRDQGVERFSLGMAPLAGRAPERSRRIWGRFGALLFRHGGSFADFETLRAFKQQFDPDWSPRYLAAPTALAPLPLLADTARLIAGEGGP